MSCTKMEKWILPYVDGRLKESEAREVDTHLAACAVCRLRVNEFRAVSGLLEELPEIEPSAAFDARVQARVAAEPAKRNWWAGLAPSPRVAFAASMLLVATVWIGSQKMQRPAAPVDTASQNADDKIDVIDIEKVVDFDVLSSFDAMTDLPDQPTQNTPPAEDADGQQM